MTMMLECNLELLRRVLLLTEANKTICIQDRKNINKEVGMLLPKKELRNTSGVGKINHYCEDIYIPPCNNTH